MDTVFCRSVRDAGGSSVYTSEASPNELHTSNCMAEQTRSQQASSEEGLPGPESDQWPLIDEKVQIDARRAALGGGLAAVAALAGAWLVGEATGAEARLLLETSLPSTRSFCGTVILALGNILALMLTLLGLSASADVDLEWSHYQRIKQIALIDTVVLTAAVIVYLLLNVPLGQSEQALEAPGMWFAAMYYSSLGLSSFLGGALIAVVLMLYNAVRDLIRVIGKNRDDT